MRRQIFESSGDEGIIENVRDQTAPYLQKRWKELAEHPLVGEVRGLGFLGAMELVADKASGKQFEPGAGVGGICRDLSAKAGLVMRAVGDTMIISPPLIMTHEQIDELVTLAHQALDQTLAVIKKSH